MLLPSSLTCDSSHANSASGYPKTRFQSSLFASPPLSPPPTASSSSHPAINNLFTTCRALQSMLTTPQQLPSPPSAHVEIPTPSPTKLRLRVRKTPAPGDSSNDRKRITKRAPPRGANKRRRAIEDDMSRDNEESDDAAEGEDDTTPSTPKRMRLAPEVIPLGLERSDFHTLHLEGMEANGEGVLESVERGRELEEWSTEEDRMLVELVLEKLKLTKSDWQDCARSLGKDRGSVGKRWKSLMGNGEVGLKHRLRRGKIHSTWR